MVVVKEIHAKSILGKSAISDYCLNCYTGCLHQCVYCYARFMKRFSGHEEPWGQFLDVKVNAPEVLAKQVRRNPPGTVFMSSVCDGWQPAERKYELSRRCLAILLESGYQVGILTKSTLVTRDLDIMRGHDNVELGMTITTLDESLRRKIEPAASPSIDRLNALREAADAGVTIRAFLGPFMPGITDTDEALDALISAIARLPVSHFYADKLNLRPGVWNSVLQFLKRWHPELIEEYRLLFFDQEEYASYCADLGHRLRTIAATHGVGEKLRTVF